MRTVINGGKEDRDLSDTKNTNDSEEYIMKGMDTQVVGGGPTIAALGGIRADTEVRVEITEGEAKPRPAY